MKTINVFNQGRSVQSNYVVSYIWKTRETTLKISFYNTFLTFKRIIFGFLQVHSELRRSWQRQKSRRYNSNIMRRSNAQNSWHRTSRSSGTSPPAAPNDADTCRSKLNNQQTTKTSHIRRSLSVCSTYMSTSCAPANGDGSRTITLIKFGDKSLRHSFRENGLKNSTLL